MQSSPASRSCLPLKSKYSPQHPVLLIAALWEIKHLTEYQAQGRLWWSLLTATTRLMCGGEESADNSGRGGGDTVGCGTSSHLDKANLHSQSNLASVSWTMCPEGSPPGGCKYSSCKHNTERWLIDIKLIWLMLRGPLVTVAGHSSIKVDSNALVIHKGEHKTKQITP
jgi:hypothetical protein